MLDFFIDVAFMINLTEYYSCEGIDKLGVNGKSVNIKLLPQVQKKFVNSQNITAANIRMTLCIKRKSASVELRFTNKDWIYKFMLEVVNVSKIFTNAFHFL